MSFPSSTVSVPTLQPYQISYQNLTMGGGSNGVNFKEWDGLDMSGTMRTGDKPRAREWGEWIGQDELPGRDIVFKCDISAGSSPGALSFATALQQFASATVPTGTTEYPLFLNLPAYGTLVCMSRPRKRAWKGDIAYTFGLAEDVSVMFHATDPRFYSTPTQVSSCTLSPITDVGFTFDITFSPNGWGFGGAQSPSSVTIDNVGNVDCRPILTITGPADNPQVINASIAGNPSIAFDYNLPSGWQIVVDTDAKSALVYASGGGVGAPIPLMPGSTWWSLQPGNNIVQLTAAGPSGASPQLSVEWASAWLL